MKHLKMFTLLILAFTIDASKVHHKSKCPDLKPMSGFKIEQLLGNWHLKMIAYKNDRTVKESCFKNNHSLEDSNTLRMDIEYYLSNGTIFRRTQRRQIDHSRPGVFLSQSERTLYGVFGNTYQKNVTTESIVLYIDSDLELRYACTQLDHFWYSEADYSYYISIKNRNFDSISKLVPLFEKIKAIPEDLNKLHFLMNDLSCTN
ncbi:hypothetical protein BpHYR1_020374 [Brachionus plicatilis]|uniref:Uncharacterized protein n=1 Tax=Brachionus plicatilis TaxID=10195 RepID=A0A3M7R825_BRAPC|nr:hypothetical protein BpHYR1_020374 [Brachionus plicatilis]